MGAEAVRVAKESFTDPPHGARSFKRTWLNAQTSKEYPTKPPDAEMDQWRDEATVVVYSAERVDKMLDARDKSIADANVRIEQLSSMLRDLAKKHDALAKRVEEADE